jgi:hypothetical protein
MMIQVYAKRKLSLHKNDLIAELESPFDVLSIVDDCDSYNSTVYYFRLHDAFQSILLQTPSNLNYTRKKRMEKEDGCAARSK